MAFDLKTLIKQVVDLLTPHLEPSLVQTEAEQIIIAAMASLHFSRIDLLSHPTQIISQTTFERVIKMAQERSQGTPLQYVIGHQFFYRHEYLVNRSTLIPRPETEVLLDEALKILHSRNSSPTQGIELGLGSGILSIELLVEFSTLTMLSSELSEGAVTVAVSNAKKILSDSNERLQIIPVEGPAEIFEPFPDVQVDFVISNPPYLLSTTASEFDPSVFKHEPHAALFAPTSDPVYFYRKIAEEGPRFLRPQGFVFLEIPHERSQTIQALFTTTNWITRMVRDLNQRERVLIAQLVNPPYNRE